MYQLDKKTKLTTKKIGEIVNSFRTSELPRLDRYYDYFKGNQDILKKQYSDNTKACNKIVTNYCYTITNNYLGYITGIPITYTSQEDIQPLFEVFNDNDYKKADSQLLRNALIYGVGYEMVYFDEKCRVRFKSIDPRECIPVYDNTLNNDLLYMIRFYPKESLSSESRFIVEVYSQSLIHTYECDNLFNSFTQIGCTPSNFREVPFTVLEWNEEKDSIFSQIMSLQDAYNNLVSAEVDDFEAFCDAYLVIKGAMADDDDLAAMKENRVLLLDADTDAQYLTKSINDTQVENMLQALNDRIHKISNSPDFNDEKFLATSGIAMKYKLVGFENTSSAIAASMTKTLQKRISLIYVLLGLIAKEKETDIQIQFTRNLPTDITEITGVVNQLRGVVSTETLISLLPFVDDSAAESEKLAMEKSNTVSMYNFPEEV